ncbi:hypothetical protein HGRIS_000786 [Hohenbuehelia grisea]
MPTSGNTSMRPSTPTSSRQARARPSSPLVFAPDRHNRPMSPITFAPPVSSISRDDSDEETELRHVHMGMGNDRASGDGHSEDGSWGVEGSEEGFGRSYGKTLPGPTRAGAISHSRATSVSFIPPDDDPFDPLAPYAQFLLLRFSTGQILEDDLVVSWYDIKPDELFELHRANVVIRLPRTSIQDYIQPYWEGWVQTLATVRENGQDEMEREWRTRVKMVWQQRWMVIKEGALSFHKDRVFAPSCQTMLLSDLTQLRGNAYKHKSAPVTATERVICARFRQPPPSLAPTEASMFERPPYTETLTTTTITTISADPPMKKRSKSKINLNFKPSSSGKKSGSSLAEGSAMANMFAVSTWKRDISNKGKGKSKAKREVLKKDKGKGREKDHERTITENEKTLDIPGDESFTDDVETDSALSSPVFARTSYSSDECNDDDSDWERRDRDHRGTWRGTGGYGVSQGGLYVDEGTDLGSRATDSGTYSEGPGEDSSTSRTRVAEAADRNTLDNNKPGQRTARESDARTEKMSEAYEGEWITMEILGDDTAYNSLLRVLHRHFPDPLASTFVAPTPTPTPFPSPASPTGKYPNFDRDGDPSERDAYTEAQEPDSPSQSESHDPLVVPAEDLRHFGTVPYPEWRVERMVKAQRAGMGDVGKAMGWMLWGSMFPDGCDMLRPDGASARSSSTKSKDTQRARRRPGTPKHPRSKSRSRSSSRKSQTSTLTPTPSVAPQPDSDPYDTDVSGAFSSGEDSDIDLPNSENEGESSEIEWQGWKTDLRRQARVRQAEAEAARAHQERQADDVDSDVRPLPLMSAAGWHQSPYRFSLVTPSPLNIPQTPAQAQRLFQEGRRALEPSAVVTSVPSPTTSTPPPPETSTETSEAWPPSSSFAPSLSSPSSSESLSARRQHHHSLTFSPVDPPSSATPLSAYPNSLSIFDRTAQGAEAGSSRSTKRALHHSASYDNRAQEPPPRMPSMPNMLATVSASSSAHAASPVQAGTPTPRSSGFPAMTLGHSLGRAVPHVTAALPARRLPIGPATSQVPVRHPTPRRSSSAGIINSSKRGSSSAGNTTAIMSGSMRDAASTYTQGGDRVGRSDAVSPQRGKTHRPKLSVATSTAQSASGIDGASSPAQITAASQSPIRKPRSLLRRVRSGPSIRDGEDAVSISSHLENLMPSRKKKGAARNGK